MEHFPESIGFFKTGRHIIVYSQFTNPCAYSVSTLRGSGMRDKDIIKSFANMVKRNAKTSKGDMPKFPYSPTELMQGTEKGPMCDLYNVIFMTLHDFMTVNEHGYAITKSKNLACKIWALANDWEALLFRDACYRNPKQVLLTMNIYRIRRSKQIINYLTKCNFCISYNDIRIQNKIWEEMVMAGESGTTLLKKGAHNSIYNIDEETESISLHFTNSNLYQPNAGFRENDDHVAFVEKFHPGATEEIPPYHIGKLLHPKPFTEFVDDNSSGMIDKCFSLDKLWSVVSGVMHSKSNVNEKLPLIGSWTHFNKQISGVQFQETIIQYMPVIPQPVNDHAVLKEYLHFLLETSDNLEIKHIFCHCDEAAYSKLLQIIWNHGDLFKRVIPILGGFHQLMCFQKIMYKRSACLGIEKWITGAGTTKSASAAEKAVQGLHYNATTRVYKEIFDAIVQLRTEDVTNNYETITNGLLERFNSTQKGCICVECKSSFK